MKKLVIALAAVIGVAAIVPMTTTAQAETFKKVIIKRGHGDHGWRHHDRGRHLGWRNHRGGKKVVIVKKRGNRHDM
jgi:Ni/Co efflux regulator RcnB